MPRRKWRRSIARIRMACSAQRALTRIFWRSARPFWRRNRSSRPRSPTRCGARWNGEGPVRDQPLRERLRAREARRSGSLHRLLRRFDSTAAGKIHANDIPKVTRALEICLLTRQPVSRLFEQGRDALPGYRTLKLGLLPDRETLNPRLDARCAWMFEHGLVEEARSILALGFPPACKPSARMLR